MNQNERILQIRKSVGLTQEDFAKRIGVSRTAIANIESGKRKVTDQMFRSVCREFLVNEDWLRSGMGEPFGKDLDDALWITLKKMGLSDHEYAIIAQFVALPPEDRGRIIEYLRLFSAAIVQEDHPGLSTSGTLTSEEAHRLLDEHFELEKMDAEESEVSGFGN